MFFLEAPEIEIAEDVAQQDETAKGDPLQHVQSGFGTADFRTQVQVRKDHRVVARRRHVPIVEN